MISQLSFAYHPTPDSRRRLRELPIEERPLYRLHSAGAGALSSTELLALVLGTAEAPRLAEELLARFGSLHRLARANKAQLTRVRGIGDTQAGRLTAVLELSRRLQAPPADERPQIRTPADAARLLTPRLRDLEQEELHVVSLDTRNRVMDMRAVYRGSLNTSQVRIAEIFRPAIEAPAAAIVVAHNHPSADPSPSPEDIIVTRQIVAAGKLLEIAVLDHLIIGGSYISLKERGLGFD